MPQSNLRALLGLLSTRAPQVLIALLALAGAACAGLAFPWALKMIIDQEFAGRDARALNVAAACLLGAAFLKFLCSFLREYLAAFIGESVVRELRGRLYRHLQELSVAHIENSSSGELIAGITQDIDAVRDFLSGGAVEFLYSLFSVVLTLWLLALLDPGLAMIALLTAPCAAGAFFFLNPRLKAAHVRMRATQAGLITRFNEFLKGVRVIAGFGTEESERRRFDAQQDEVFSAAMGTNRLGLAAWLGSELAAAAGLTALLWWGARGVMEGRMSAGVLSAAYGYAGMLFMPLSRMVVVNTYYQEASAAFERIRRQLAAAPRVVRAGTVVRASIKGDIRFANVVFGYGSRSVFAGLNLKISAGETVALVGKSGAGKTTLINLLLRFYDPGAGSVLIDGIDLRRLDLRAYRARIAIVPQDDYLFNASIRDNIAYGDPGADLRSVRGAARAARAEEFIDALPDGYATVIGEGGVKLSRGQRQRISIARAILRDPAILLLDEATSNVDSATECGIIESAYGNAVKGRTTLMIAHRLQAARIAGRIIVMDNGAVIESGSHADLMGRGAVYRRMWQGMVATGAGTQEVPAEACSTVNR